MAVRLPILVIHAEDDKEVAFSNAEALARGWGPHVRLMRANGSGHRRIVSAPEVTAAGWRNLPAGGRTAAGSSILPLSGSDKTRELPADERGRPRRLA